MREQAPDSRADDANFRILSRGIPLTWSEPRLVVLDGAVYHHSSRNPVRAVTASWSRFLSHWLASGCFASHHFPTLWPIVKDFVPTEPAPKANEWLRYYEKRFNGVPTEPSCGGTV
jgi:hypothetical protein